MQYVTENLIIKTNHEYPPHNLMVFEEYFYKRYIEDKPFTSRTYLPIQWTSCYLARNCKKDSDGVYIGLIDIQNFLDALPRDKKYFTIVQYDDGILNDLSGFDIYKFASGGIGDYPIPLICMPYKKINKDRDIFASFVGTIKGRHPVREKMYFNTKDRSDYHISELVNFDCFKDIMERSVFSLCPRGYGKTSFRINESLNLGSIPVYIYDDPWIPFFDEIDFKNYGVLIHESDLHQIDDILKSYSTKQIEELREYGRYVYNEYFIYESCYNKILKKLIVS